jgi:hypothetical protein
MHSKSLNSKEFNSLLAGIILGDAHLRSLTKRENKSSLEIKQEFKKLSYVKWLHQQFECIGVNPILPRSDAKGWRFSSKPSLLLGEYRKKFYPKGKKIVPKDLEKVLVSPIGLAIWYMDDGTLDQRRRYHCNSIFSTHGFTFKDCQNLKKFIKNNFGIYSSVHKSTIRGKKYWRLYILSKSMDDFKKIISPWILPIFEYKLPKL